jgi:hypothetical protein
VCKVFNEFLRVIKKCKAPVGVVLLSRSRGGRDDSLIKAFVLLRLEDTRTRRGRLDRPPATDAVYAQRDLVLDAC